MTVLRAIVFDVFETLYANTPDLWLKTFEDICRTQRLWVDAQPLWERWRHFERQFRQRRTSLDDPAKSPPFMTYEEAWRIAFERVFGEMGLTGDPAEVARIAVRHMAQRPPYQDAVQTLPLLRQGPWKLAVLSNADNAYLCPVLERWPLVPFDAVLSSETARVYKPHPDAFRQVLEHIGVTAEEATYVGDSPYDDVHGAKLAGMGAVWLNRNGQEWDFASNLLPPDYEIRSLTELPPIVGPLSKGGGHA